LEQRHADQLRLVQEVAQADRDQLVSQLQQDLDKRQQQLLQTKEEESRLKESLQAMSEVRFFGKNYDFLSYVKVVVVVV
jgi:hypothetical protein